MAQESRNTVHADIERELAGHPKVVECAVAEVETGPGKTTLLAYVVGVDDVDGAELRSFLLERMPGQRLPEAVALVPSLPRTPEGELDLAALPLPVQPGQTARGGKGGIRPGEPMDAGVAMVIGTPIAALLAYLMTDVFWPYATDLSAVPQPWAAFFTGLYAFECLSFGLGVSFLLVGRRTLARSGRSPRLTAAAHVAIAWLLAAWWPQDNFYRLAAKTDWPRQAALVYAFNITLMIAAAVVVCYLAAKPSRPED